MSIIAFRRALRQPADGCILRPVVDLQVAKAEGGGTEARLRSFQRLGGPEARRFAHSGPVTVFYRPRGGGALSAPHLGLAFGCEG